MDRLIVLVNSNERHIDIEAGEVEVVRVTTKEGRLEFRHKHQTNVSVFFVTIQIVLAALIQSYYVASQASGLV